MSIRRRGPATTSCSASVSRVADWAPLLRVCAAQSDIHVAVVPILILARPHEQGGARASKPAASDHAVACGTRVLGVRQQARARHVEACVVVVADPLANIAGHVVDALAGV